MSDLSTAAARNGRARAQTGVMLLEALIAILIFSVGVLSIVQLQALSVKQSADAEYRSQAALLASDLVSRMWGTDRKLATLQALYGEKNGQGYEDWMEVVEASRLPGATSDQHAPKIEVTPAPDGLKDTTQVIIKMYWEAPGVAEDASDEDKQNAKHSYVTTVMLR